MRSWAKFSVPLNQSINKYKSQIFSAEKLKIISIDTCVRIFNCYDKYPRQTV
jgi:hypothetical protein